MNYFNDFMNSECSSDSINTENCNEHIAHNNNSEILDSSQTGTSDTSLQFQSKSPHEYIAQNNDVGVYGFSLTGSSHLKSKTVCQDYSDFLYLSDENIWIFAIADGVGSCSLSHWGAYTAVIESMNSIKEQITLLSNGKVVKLSDVPNIEEIFQKAFSFAREKVELFADNCQKPIYDFQSTLTVAVYDGLRLACCHVGDDGIVAEGVSGKCLMITNRFKGEEANSVVTLQSGLSTTTIVKSDVVGFIMSTDGILDYYVGNASVNNRVYYPFFQEIIYGMRPSEDISPLDAVKQASRKLKESFLTPTFQKRVTDDITVLAVANQSLLSNPDRLNFSQKNWDEETKKIEEERRKIIYPSSPKPLSRPQIKNFSSQASPNNTPTKAASHRQTNSQPNISSPQSEEECDSDSSEVSSSNFPDSYDTEMNFQIPKHSAIRSLLNEFRPILYEQIGQLCNFPEIMQCQSCGIYYENSKNLIYCPQCGKRLQKIGRNL